MVSDWVSVDFCLKLANFLRAPSMAGTSSISSALPAVESGALSRRPAYCLTTQSFRVVGNAEQGIEGVGMDHCVVESITTRLRA